MLAGELPAAVLGAQCEIGGQLEAIIASPHKDTGRMPLQLTRQHQLLREYAQGAPGTERPYGPETASVAAEGKEETRHFWQAHCHDPE